MQSPELAANDTDSALMAGAAMVDPKSISRPSAADACIPFLAVPQDFKLESLDKLFPRPAWRRGTTTLDDTQSFIDFVEAEREFHSAPPRLFCLKGDKPSFTAIFNDDARGDCIARYNCPLSRQWKLWTGMDKKEMQQTPFAEFLEDNRLDISDPSTSLLLEVAQNLQATTSGNFKSKINRVNGSVVFGYSEETTATTGDSNVAVPERFKLAIPVFDGGEKWEVEARLRYRIMSGRLVLYFVLDGADRVMENATEEMVKAIGDATHLPLYHGSQSNDRSIPV